MIRQRHRRERAAPRADRWIAWCCWAALLWTLGARPLAADDGEERGDSPSAAEIRLRQAVEYFSSLGSRVAGYPGSDSAAAYIERQFAEIGLRSVRAEAFQVDTQIAAGHQLPEHRAPLIVIQICADAIGS